MKLQKGCRARAGLILVALGFVAVLACDGPLSKDLCAPDAATIAQIQAPHTYRCHALDPEVELDPDNPDYGRVTCSVIEGRQRAEHPAFCDCQEQGYSPLPDSEVRAAAEQSLHEGLCEPPCCESLCYCELNQLAGEDLTACQNSGVRVGGQNGWCFVAPNLGLGTLEAIERNDYSYQAHCPSPQAIVYTGDYLDGTRLVSCWR